ncbi:hypothetical protein HID58_073976 [Brassica napus]|uniref:Uncharacterized protein n=1 Tax=Brassica napus TaxID=3708 RepID=A0ABQ7YGT5_BRANA|nr:hypothetical protein HID58_073976 [Brassica napus]
MLLISCHNESQGRCTVHWLVPVR